MYVADNIKQFASTHETSDEVAAAIFEIADEGDEERLWQDPTDAEYDAVEKRAWELADPANMKLHWGCTTLQRGVSRWW